MIELAPRHKIGLPLASPVLIGSGFCGYGDVYQRLIDLSAFGAVVTQPVTLRPRRGSSQPRVAEINGGFLLDTGNQNPGVKKVLQRYSKIWTRLGVPVIPHLPADEPDDLMRTARALTGAITQHGESPLAALELGIPEDTLPVDVADWVVAIRSGSELPVLVKLPISALPELAAAAADAGADALVIGAPPVGVAAGQRQDAFVTGHLYGPVLHHLTLHSLRQLTRYIDLPIIAAGGIHTLADVQRYFDFGASAVQLDSLLFVDPQQAETIAREATKAAGQHFEQE